MLAHYSCAWILSCSVVDMLGATSLKKTDFSIPSRNQVLIDPILGVRFYTYLPSSMLEFFFLAWPGTIFLGEGHGVTITESMYTSALVYLKYTISLTWNKCGPILNVGIANLSHMILPLEHQLESGRNEDKSNPLKWEYCQSKCLGLELNLPQTLVEYLFT